MNKGTLTFFCGKMGSGKSTYARSLKEKQAAFYFAEDELLFSIFKGEITTVPEYLHYSQNLKVTLQPYIVSLLKLGVDVILDFPSNTVSQRRWFSDIASESGCRLRMIYLAASDTVCLDRIEGRVTKEPHRLHLDNPAMYFAATRYFVEPTSDECEGLECQIIDAENSIAT